MQVQPTASLFDEAPAGEPGLMMDINTTPLIDVLLVLLVMLIITIPVQLHAVNLELPVGQARPNPLPPPVIDISIKADDGLFWQDEAVDAATLEQKMAVVAHLAEQPEVHVRTAKEASYAKFVSVMAASRRKGLKRIAVVGHEQFAGP